MRRQVAVWIVGGTVALGGGVAFAETGSTAGPRVAALSSSSQSGDDGVVDDNNADDGDSANADDGASGNVDDGQSGSSDDGDDANSDDGDAGEHGQHGLSDGAATAAGRAGSRVSTQVASMQRRRQ